MAKKKKSKSTTRRYLRLSDEQIADIMREEPFCVMIYEQKCGDSKSLTVRARKLYGKNVVAFDVNGTRRVLKLLGMIGGKHFHPKVNEKIKAVYRFCSARGHRVPKSLEVTDYSKGYADGVRDGVRMERERVSSGKEHFAIPVSPPRILLAKQHGGD